MVTDKWEIFHIAIVVDDLDAAMSAYSRGLGIEWGPVGAPGPDALASMHVEPKTFSIDGLRATVGVVGDGPGQVGSAPLELVDAKPGTPASTFYGCPDGRHYLHHIAYLVDDIEAESAKLSSEGFEREVSFRQDGRLVMAYHRTPSSFRIQLYPAQQEA
jgi:hypothetical protein